MSEQELYEVYNKAQQTFFAGFGYRFREYINVISMQTDLMTYVQSVAYPRFLSVCMKFKDLGHDEHNVEHFDRLVIIHDLNLDEAPAIDTLSLPYEQIQEIVGSTSFREDLFRLVLIKTAQLPPMYEMVNTM